MNFLKTVSVAAVMAATALTANAAVITLDFEGVNASYPSTTYSTVGDFYSGGTSGDGTTGTDFGISFSENALAICLNTTGVNCSNTSRGGLGNPDSQRGGLFFLDGAETFMNVAAGFMDGFSFFYSAAFNPGSIEVFEGLGGTGAILASLSLPTNSGTCSGSNDFCPFTPIGVAFSGTARSVSFAGSANQIVFDDVTFGSMIPDPDPNPSAVPVPASLPLLLAGLGGLGVLRRRRRG